MPRCGGCNVVRQTARASKTSTTALKSAGPPRTHRLLHALQLLALKGCGQVECWAFAWNLCVSLFASFGRRFKGSPCSYLQKKNKSYLCASSPASPLIGWRHCVSYCVADLIENMQQADQKNWDLDQQSMDNLCCSLNTFFRQTGVVPNQSHSLSAGRSHISQHSGSVHGRSRSRRRKTVALCVYFRVVIFSWVDILADPYLALLSFFRSFLADPYLALFFLLFSRLLISPG